MKIKNSKEWKTKNGRVIECIAKDCDKIANSDCMCWKHLEEKNKEPNS